MKALRVGTALLLGVPAGVAAQSAGVEVGRYFEGDDWTTFRVELERPLLGPLSVVLYGTHLRAAGDTGERLWGGGADLALFRDAGRGPYVVGGLGGGFATHAAKDFWGSWSAGAGYQLGPLSAFSLAAEARWRKLTPGARDGLELSLRLGAAFGSRAAGASAREPATTLSARGASRSGAGVEQPVPLAVPGRLGESATLVDSVVATAGAAMGAAYRLGGTSSSGFDCSGLIQYAYARHGVALPRTSTEQARAGEKVARRLEALRPGDILTFSSSGGPVTHVGLYVGDGRFVHSATGGVQLSRLDPDDPYGKWWWARWVGARRVVPGEK
jgi:cell wall-associated NlpC family hydrolase